MPDYLRHYIPNSIVFITIVTYHRNPLLIKNINNLRIAFKTCPYKFDILAACVLPDHLHLLIKPNNIEQLSKIISSIKYCFSKSIINIIKPETSRREKGIWQRRFYDHIIRSEEDLNRHIDYIHYNPVKHGLVKASKDWEYSSFSKYVKNGQYEENWCNFEDKYNINDLNLE